MIIELNSINANDTAAANTAGESRMNSHQGEEKRREHRSRVFKGASILIAEKESIYDCLLKNQTEDGGMVTIDDTMRIPGQFRFKIGPQGAWRDAQAIWRDENRIGFKFV